MSKKFSVYNAGGGSGRKELVFRTLYDEQLAMYARSLDNYTDFEKSHREQEKRQIAVIEKPISMYINVAREDFPNISSRFDIVYVPSSATQAWGKLMKEICIILKIDFIHSIIDRADKSPVHRLLRIRPGGDYFVRQRETAAILEVISSGKTPMEASWDIAMEINKAKQDLALMDQNIPLLKQRVLALVSKPITRDIEREVTSMILNAKTPVEVVSIIEEFHAQYQRTDTDLGVLQSGDNERGDNVINTTKEISTGRKPYSEVAKYHEDVDIVTLHRLCLEKMHRLVIENQEKLKSKSSARNRAAKQVVGDDCFSYVSDIIEQMRSEVDVTSMGLKLICSVSSYIGPIKLKVLHLLLDCIQAYAPPAPAHRKRCPKRLNPELLALDGYAWAATTSNTVVAAAGGGGNDMNNNVNATMLAREINFADKYNNNNNNGNGSNNKSIANSSHNKLTSMNSNMPVWMIRYGDFYGGGAAATAAQLHMSSSAAALDNKKFSELIVVKEDGSNRDIISRYRRHQNKEEEEEERGREGEDVVNEFEGVIEGDIIPDVASYEDDDIVAITTVATTTATATTAATELSPERSRVLINNRARRIDHSTAIHALQEAFQPTTPPPLSLSSHSQSHDPNINKGLAASSTSAENGNIIQIASNVNTIDGATTNNNHDNNHTNNKIMDDLVANNSKDDDDHTNNKIMDDLVANNSKDDDDHDNHVINAGLTTDHHNHGNSSSSSSSSLLLLDQQSQAKEKKQISFDLPAEKKQQQQQRQDRRTAPLLPSQLQKQQQQPAQYVFKIGRRRRAGDATATNRGDDIITTTDTTTIEQQQQQQSSSSSSPLRHQRPANWQGTVGVIGRRARKIIVATNDNDEQDDEQLIVTNSTATAASLESDDRKVTSNDSDNNNIGSGVAAAATPSSSSASGDIINTNKSNNNNSSSNDSSANSNEVVTFSSSVIDNNNNNPDKNGTKESSSSSSVMTTATGTVDGGTTATTAIANYTTTTDTTTVNTDATSTVVANGHPPSNTINNSSTTDDTDAATTVIINSEARPNVVSTGTDHLGTNQPEAHASSSSTAAAATTVDLATLQAVTPKSPFFESSARIIAARFKKNNKKRRQRVALEPLPVVPCVLFRPGPKGRMQQSMAITQSFAALFKVIAEGFTIRNEAFNIGLVEEISDVATVCQALPRALEYYIWIVDALYKDGFGDELELAEGKDITDDNSTVDYTMVLSQQSSSPNTEGNASDSVIDMVFDAVSELSVPSMNAGDDDGMLSQISIAVNIGKPLTEAQEANLQAQLAKKNAYALRQANLNIIKNKDDLYMNHAIAAGIAAGIGATAENEQVGDDGGGGAVTTHTTEEGEDGGSFAASTADDEDDNSSNGAGGLPNINDAAAAAADTGTNIITMSSNEVGNNSEKKDDKDAFALLSSKAKKASKAAAAAGPGTEAAREDEEAVQMKVPSMKKAQNKLLMQTMGLYEYEARYVQKPSSDSIILAVFLVSVHHELQERERQMARRWLDIWDDNSRAYKMLKRKGMDLAGL